MQRRTMSRYAAKQRQSTMKETPFQMSMVGDSPTLDRAASTRENAV